MNGRKVDENTRIIIKNVLGAFIVKGTALVLSLYTLPAYMRFFKDQVVLGVWFTILSVLSWILNFDLGIGNGLRNHLAKAIVQKDYDSAKKYISSSYISIGFVSLTAVAIYCFVSPHIDWYRVLNIPTNIVSKEALHKSVDIVFIGIAAQLLLKLISSILYALQKSAVNNFLTLCSAVLVFLYIKLAPSYGSDTNIVAIATVQTIAVLLPLLCANIFIFLTTLKRAMVSFYQYRKEYAKQILTLGGAFFFVQVAYMIIMSTNEYLITVFANAEYVVTYQIYYRIFSFAGTVFALALTPIWSAVTKALSEENYCWIRKLYKKLLLLAGVGCICEILIVPVLQSLVNYWLKEDAIQVHQTYALVFAVMGSLSILNGVFSSIANGVGQLKSQALFFGVGAFVKVPVAWFLVNVLHSWIGVMIANVLAMALYCGVQPFLLSKFLNKKRKEVGESVC